MDLTPDERPVVSRAVAAYREARKKHQGPFRGVTADDILEELTPTPVRWTELAAFVIATAEGPTEGIDTLKYRPMRQMRHRSRREGPRIH